MTSFRKLLAASLFLAGLALTAAGLVSSDARAYCPPPCPGAGTSPAATAAQNSAQTLIQRITSGQLSIEQARSMATEMEKQYGNTLAAQQLRDAADACEKSGNCVAPPATTTGTTTGSAASTASTQPPIPVTIPPAQAGKPGAVYQAIVASGTVFFVDDKGGLVPYVPGKAPPAVFTGNLSDAPASVSAPSTDLMNNLPKGSQLIVGYGLGVAGLSDTFDSMIKNASYNVVYTKP